MAAVNTDNQKCRLLINQQSEIGTLIIAPMLLLCLIFMPIVIKILYSNKFIGAIDYILWAIPGMFFKLCSWAIAIMFVSKGVHKTYIANEVIGNTVSFICSIVGYYFYGLAGLGIGFTIGYFIYFLRVFVVAVNRYEFSFTSSFKLLWMVQFVLVVLGLIDVLLLNEWTMYVIGGMLICISSLLSLKGLNQRLNIFKH